MDLPDVVHGFFFFFLLNIDVIKNQFLNFLCFLCLGNYKFLINAIFKIYSI
jgi:hypothetical protein